MEIEKSNASFTLRTGCSVLNLVSLTKAFNILLLWYMIPYFFISYFFYSFYQFTRSHILGHFPPVCFDVYIRIV